VTRGLRDSLFLPGAVSSFAMAASASLARDTGAQQTFQRAEELQETAGGALERRLVFIRPRRQAGDIK
jgi:hypothetical protein